MSPEVRNETETLINEVRRLTQALGGTLHLPEDQRPWPGRYSQVALDGKMGLYVQVIVTTTETGLTVQVRNPYGVPVAQMTWVYE